MMESTADDYLTLDGDANALRRRKAEGLRCEPGGHGHRLLILLSNPGNARHVVIAGIAQDHEPMASALMAETILLASASASRILLPTADN